MAIDLSKYVVQGATPTTKKQREVNPHRVTVGQVFIQPTGGTKGKPHNFTYPYFGMLSSEGSYIGGFSMSSIAMLEAVQAGLLPKSFKAAFDKYAAYAVSQGHNAVKVA